MDCRIAKSRLNRYLDGELSDRNRRALERHVAACAACSEALERLRAAGAAVLQLAEPPDVPAGFAQRVIARAARRREQRPLVVPFWKLFSPAMRAAAAAMVMLGLGIGVLMGLDLVRGPATPSDVAAADPDAVYGFDYLSDAPGGSLADAYITLASTNNGGGQ